MYIKDRTELRDKMLLIYKQAEHLIDGGAIDVEVKKHEPNRSTAQNSYYHLICSEVAKFLDEAGLTYGEYKTKYTSALIHEINKSNFDIKTTTKLNMREFCDYMTQVIQYWQEKTNYFWMPSELPAIYLQLKGYTEEYTKGYINDKDV